MKRRDFIKKSLSAGLFTGAAFSLGGMEKLLGNGNNPLPAENYDMVAIKNGEPDVMLDEGFKLLGGIQKYVKKGNKVVIKPNIGWDTVPERGANTNPLLVKRLAKLCKDAGASEVYVFDYTCDDWTKCYKNSGIEDAAKEAGAKMVPGNMEKYYQDIQIPNGKKLTKEKVHELILSSDVFFNVPILKHHSSAKLSISLKNLMGITWHRKEWHKNDLHQCIADFGTWDKKPTLNIVDAYYVMKKNGPRGVSKSDVVTMKSLIMSSDMVTADAAASKLFGIEPDTIPYIRIAHEMGVGNKNMDGMSIGKKVL